MFGKNPIRPPEKGDGRTLHVHKIFPTLQGEGPFAGRPSVFIRLGGCNLACDFCDTEFEDFHEMPVGHILAQVQDFSANVPTAAQTKYTQSKILAVITGGEPFRQPIGPLCDVLLEAGFDVQIETNGTLYRPIDPRVSIVCSPKTTTGDYARLRPDLLENVSALKFIVSRGHPLYQDVPEIGQQDYDIPVYVQPMDEYDESKNSANLAFAKELAASKGYLLSQQMHKIWGIE